MSIPPRDPDATRSQEAGRLRAILGDVDPDRLREERARTIQAALVALELLRMVIELQARRQRRRWFGR